MCSEGAYPLKPCKLLVCHLESAQVDCQVWNLNWPANICSNINYKNSREISKRKIQGHFQARLSQDPQAQLRQEKIHFLSTFSIGQGDFVRKQVSGSCVALELPKGNSFQEYKIRLGEIRETMLPGDHRRD